jgi:glycosyltransferase involved in cell wall biosynthesis
LLCAKDDPAALAEILGRMVDDPEFRRELAARGRAAVEREFTADVMARGYAAVCAAAVGAGGGK